MNKVIGQKQYVSGTTYTSKSLLNRRIVYFE